MQPFTPALVTIEHNRLSLTQGIVKLEYADHPLGTFDAQIFLVDGDWHPRRTDPEWLEVAEEIAVKQGLAAPISAHLPDQAEVEAALRDEASRIDPIASLVEALEDWCKSERIKPQSADELAVSEDLSPKQRAVAKAFSNLWEAMTPADSGERT